MTPATQETLREEIVHNIELACSTKEGGLRKILGELPHPTRQSTETISFTHDEKGIITSFGSDKGTYRSTCRILRRPAQAYGPALDWNIDPRAPWQAGEIIGASLVLYNEGHFVTTAEGLL